MGNQTLLEIERKYLIKYPDTRLLSEIAGVHMSTIVQTYLDPETHPHARVRARTENGHTVYTHTVKTPVSALTRIEDEREISFTEYEALRAEADKASAPIYKTRYNLPFEGCVFEIDIYLAVSSKPLEVGGNVSFLAVVNSNHRCAEIGLYSYGDVSRNVDSVLLVNKRSASARGVVVAGKSVFCYLNARAAV